MNQRPRTIVFGLDGFDFEFAKSLARQGRLPWLSAQLQHGSQVATRCSTLPGSEWASAACGVSAAHHGYLHTSQLRVGTYEFVDTDATVVRTDPFYVPLAKAGIETIVLDLPVDRPRPSKHLTQVIDWGTEFKLFRYCTTPARIRGFVKQVGGDHPFTNYGTTVPDDATLIELRDKLVKGTALKAELTRAFMRRSDNWSVLFAGFGEIHKGGHFFWKYQDPQHPDYEGSQHPLATALEELYETLDSELLNISAMAGEATNIIVVTDRGMRANYRGNHLIVPILRKLGLYGAPDAQSHSKTISSVDELRSATRAREPVLRRLKQHVPVALRPLMRRLGGFAMDWSRIRVFPVPEVGNTYLRVNVRGREPRGIVEPGVEYTALLEYLKSELMMLINPDTGNCAVEEVRFPRREFAGPHNDALPDVCVVWTDHGTVNSLESASIGRIDGPFWEQRSGNHSNAGAILVSGPSFAAGVSRSGDLREVAPTLLALHGVQSPMHFEYPPMPEMLNPLRRHE